MSRFIALIQVVTLLVAGAGSAWGSAFYSQGSVSPDLVSSWNSDRAGAGAPPADFAAGDVFVIQTGHAMSTAAAWTVTGTGAAIQIENGGTLTANHLVSAPTFQIDAGGTYVHNAASAVANGAATDIPGAIRTLDAASTVEIRKWANGGTAPVALPNVAWGNLVVNVASLAGNWSQGSNLQTVNGSLTVLATGSGSRQLRLTGGGTSSVEVKGGYAQSGGYVTCSAVAGTIALNVAGNFALTGGTFSMAEGLSVNSTVNLSGNFTHTAGTLTENGNAGGLIAFKGKGVQIFTSGGTVTQTLSWQVASAATLDVGTSIVLGGGTFTLQSGGRLMIGSPSGISASNASGNIQTAGSRTFSTTADYVYKGVAAQVTGSGLPTTVNHFTVDNPAGVTLGASLTVNGTLSLASGAFAIGTRTLTLNGPVSAATGTISSATTGVVLYSSGTPGQGVAPGSYGTLTLNNTAKTLWPSGTIRIAGVFTPGSGVHTVTGSTVEFEGAGAQTIPAIAYHHLVSSGAGTRTLPSGGTVRIAGSFTPGSNAYTLTGSTVVYDGVAPQTIPAGFPTYQNLTIANPAGVTLGGNVTVQGTLALTAGAVTTGPAAMIIGPAATVTRSAGHVAGFLRKPIASGFPSVTFEVGSASGYAPVALAFSGVAGPGTLTASTTDGDHPSLASSGIDGARSVNRYWSLTHSGITFDSYDITLSFQPGDVDAGATPSAFTVQTFDDPDWSATATSTLSPTSVQAHELKSFSDFAAGELKIHTIDASAGPDGVIDPAGALPVTDGQSRAFTIAPDPHHFIADVLVDGASVGPVTGYTFSNVKASHTIAASFALTTHTVTVTAGPNGTVDPTGAVVVADGSDRGFTITPAPHYHVLDVKADGVSVGPVTSWTFTDVTADHTLEASFEITTHAITASAGTNGAIAPAGTVMVVDGDDQGFTITPDPHYHVLDLVVDGVSQGPLTAYTLTGVTAGHTLSATFEQTTHVVTATAGPHGAIDPSGAVVVIDGAEQVFAITPDAEHHIVDVRVDGLSQGAVASVTLTGVTAAHTVEADFSIDTYTLTAVAGPDGAIVPSGAVVVPSSGSQGFDVAADPGSYLVDVLVDGVSIGPVAHYDFTGVLASHTIEAVFRRNDVLIPLLRFRADRADGADAYPTPGAQSPWVDLIGDHDATLAGFTGTPASGWKGDSTVASPRRLHWSGGSEVAVVPGPVPALQNTDPVTAELWFRTGFDGSTPEPEYLVEWSDSTHAGMSIAIQDGQLRVFLDPWVDVVPVAPASWYHLAVAKEAGQVRVYLDGGRVFTGGTPMLGRQLSPLAIGASAHGFNQGTPVHTDFFRGDVAQVTVWRGAFGDSQAVAAFQADSALYLPPPVETPEPVVVLRADHAAGAGPCPSPGAAGPWADLAGTASDATLIGFDGNAASGWQGVGSPGSPYRLRFDGVNDLVAIAPGAVGELLTSCAVTAELWFRPETEVPAGAWQYLIEWLQGFGTSSGMAVAISDGQVQLHLERVGWVALGPAQSGEWCHLVVVKAPGQVRVYRNGAPVYAGALPDFGEPNSEIVLGGSTWRGPGIHDDFFAGSIAQVCLRRGAMSDTEAAEAFAADQARYFGVLDAPAAPQRLLLAGARPNPGIGGSLAVAFTLPSGAAASLDLIDIAGRRIAHEDVGALGPGPHLVRLGRGLDLPAGVYLIRLQQAGRALTAKATLMN